MKEPIFSEKAQRQLRALRVYDQRRIISEIRAQLVDTDPQEQTQNKFRLRRSSQYADFELRIGHFRVFYRVENDGTIYLALIGKKEKNRLLVNGEEFEL